MFCFLLLLYIELWCIHEALKISSNINIIFCDELSATNCPRRIIQSPHVLRALMPPTVIRKYDLRPIPHNFVLPDKDDCSFIARVLYKSSSTKQMNSSNNPCK